MIHVNFWKLDQLICHLSVISSFFGAAKLLIEIYVVGFSLLLPVILWLASAILYTWKWMMTSFKTFCLVFVVDILLISLKY